MSEILYLKPEKNVRTYNRVLTLGEAVEMQCADPAIVNRLKTEKLYAFQDVKPADAPAQAARSSRSWTWSRKSRLSTRVWRSRIWEKWIS